MPIMHPSVVNLNTNEQLVKDYDDVLWSLDETLKHCLAMNHEGVAILLRIDLQRLRAMRERIAQVPDADCSPMSVRGKSDPELCGRCGNSHAPNMLCPDGGFVSKGGHNSMVKE